MDSFLDAILNDYKEGHLSHKQTKDALSFLFYQTENQNADEVIDWLKQGRKYARHESVFDKAIALAQSYAPPVSFSKSRDDFFERTKSTFSVLIKSIVKNDIGTFYHHIL